MLAPEGKGEELSMRGRSTTALLMARCIMRHARAEANKANTAGELSSALIQQCRYSNSRTNTDLAIC